MHRAIRGRELLEYVGAEKEFSAHPSASAPITTMIRLAMEAMCGEIRQRAADWLLRHVGVVVIIEEGSNAAPTAAEGIRR